MKRHHGWALLALVAAAASCSDPVGPASERSVLNLRYEATGPLADARLLTFNVANGGWHAAVHGGDLDYQGPGIWWTNEPLPIASPGTLDIEVLLRDGADTLAVGRMPFDVRRGWSYGLEVYIGRGDPRRFSWVICIPDVYAFPIRASGMGADSLYLVWSGLPRGAIC